MGAILAAEYARKYRREVSGLVLLNAPMFRSEREAKERIREMSPMAAMFSVQRFWARDRLETITAATAAELLFVRGAHNIYLTNPDEVVRHLAVALHQ